MKSTFIVNENVIMYAFRYALGRSTYAVAEMAEYIIDNKNLLSDNTKKQIVEEIKFHYDRAVWKGYMQCDKDCWDNVVRELGL